MKISVVIPVYGAPHTIATLHSALTNQIQKMGYEYEIIFVNDSCPKNSWSEILKICKNDVKIKGINLVKNFGQHNAIACGLEHVTGDWVYVMDCDLQDDPAYMGLLLDEALKGYDVVIARRDIRKESLFKKAQSYFFFKILSIFSGIKLDHRNGNYGVYSKRVIDSINSLQDRVRIFPLMVSWFGYDTSFVSITQMARHEGKSSYTFTKAIKLAFDLTIALTTRPLIWSVQVGAVSALLSIILAISFIVRYFLYGLAPSGWTSLIVVISFSTGVILLNLGIFGLYLARVYDQVRLRPYYHIKTKLNL